VFTGGKRAQDITNIAIRMTLEQRGTRMTPQGPQPHTESREVVPRTVVTQAFSSTPGQPSSFPFQLTVPGGLPSTTQGAVTYHLRASADIDNEVDPGASQEVQVLGTGPAMAQGMPGQMMPGQGMPGQMMPGQGMPGQMMPGQMPGQGMPGQMMPGMAGMAGVAAGMAGMAGQMMPGQGMPGQMMPGQMPGQGMPGQPMPGFQIGTRVMAQWQDGQFHPGRIQFAQNGMYYVDWEEAHLGQTTPVYPQQMQLHPQQHGAPQAAGYAQQAVKQDMGKQGIKHDPYAAQASKQDPYAKGHVEKGGHDPYAKGAAPGGHDPYAKGAAPGGALNVGAAVMAQHPQNQQWYPGRVAAVQNGMVGVDWDDEALGASSWVSPGAVQPR
jgi:hypothetical protein